ncbi:hypothetical protein I6E86_06395 [Psychrobacter sp. SWN149]|nr:hypothetical protein [Psychrobacter sp. SWN149]
MPISASKPPSFAKSKPYHLKASAIFLSMLLLTACQKDPDPEIASETSAETANQTTPVTSNINTNAADDAANNEANSTAQTDSEHDVSLSQLDDNLGSTKEMANTKAVTPDPHQAIKGAQITDVRYKSATGESLSVVFETSAAGMLNAIVTLPNKPKMTLSAPEGQGNNPTYQSNNGAIQLVSHAGGGTIDLIQNNKVTSFDAVSAEAEVVTE